LEEFDEGADGASKEAAHQRVSYGGRKSVFLRETEHTRVVLCRDTGDPDAVRFSSDGVVAEGVGPRSTRSTVRARLGAGRSVVGRKSRAGYGCGSEAEVGRCEVGFFPPVEFVDLRQRNSSREEPLLVACTVSVSSAQ
jgi:hypothetical protein